MTGRFWAQVEYDGTDLAGFQIQITDMQGRRKSLSEDSRLRTVQGEIERALRQVTGVETRVIGAGRTDSGVHAKGQIIAFDAVWRHELTDLHRALNAVLAADVAIVWVGMAPERFHPRFDAVSRTYRYTMLTRPCRSPLNRHRAWHVPYQLDIDRMAQASRCLIGTHDFSTFGRPPKGENAVRTVSQAEWRADCPVPSETGPGPSYDATPIPDPKGSGAQYAIAPVEWVTLDITANAFLYHMVRSLVGSLVLVGSGRLSVDEFEAMLLARDSSLAKQLAPAHGLCLMRVDYKNVAVGFPRPVKE
ncbi:MAG: tRNA pseudouridine(38-40) synthase TruA [Anaerolineae bacterium]|nr:tRNA pseudouridine(38-40) synthase TruA [Anaerolineae bacterium]